MKKLLLSLFVAALPVMCATTKPGCGEARRLVLSRPGKVGVKFDKEVPSRYKVAFAQALLYWEQVIDVTFWDDSNEETCSIELSVGSNPDKNTLAETFIPDTMDYSGRVIVNVDGDIKTYADSKLVYIFIHELGHVFGLKHSADDSSVMYASTDGGLVLLPADLKALSVYHELIRAIYQVKETQ